MHVIDGVRRGKSGRNRYQIFIYKRNSGTQCIDIANIWPFQRGYFSEILSNKRFEARKLRLHPTAKNYKLRFSVTGHEQNGEFTPRAHFVTVNGASSKNFHLRFGKNVALIQSTHKEEPGFLIAPDGVRAHQQKLFTLISVIW